MKTTDDFITEVLSIRGNLYDYSLVDYRGTHNKIKIICRLHGPFEQTPNNHLSKKQGCPLCKKKTPTKPSIFFRRALEKHGTTYDYSLVEYKHAHSKIIIICPIHGSFLQTPSCHINHDQGCPQCAPERFKRTNLRNLGVDNPRKSEVVKNKIKQTCFNRYGVENPHQNKEIQEKIKQTNLKNHGVEYHKQKHMLNILPLLEDRDWLVGQYITNNKSAAQIAAELKIDTTTVCEYLRKVEIKIRQHYWTSSKCNQWLDNIRLEQNIVIIPEYRFNLSNKKHKADGYCVDTNTIYEFYGDYWHGNPNVYDGGALNCVIGKTMGELFDATIKREHMIKSLGYVVVTMWEQDWNNQQHGEIK